MNEEQRTGEVQFSVKDLMRVFLKRWWIILACIALGAAAAFLIARLPASKYQSETLIYVNNRKEISVDVGLSTGDLSASKTLSSTYRVILETRETMEAVIRDAGVSYTYEELKEMVSLSTVGDSPVICITVTSPSAEEAYRIAGSISVILPSRIDSTVQQASSVVVDHAVIATEEVSREYPKKMIIGMLIGLVLSAAACIVYDLFINDRIQSEDWLIQTFGEEIPVLAVIPDAGSHRHGGYYGRYRAYGGDAAGKDASGRNGGTAT